MQSKTYLMSFEQMIQLLAETTNHVGPSPDLFEKLSRTWWEVEIAGENHIPLQCSYVADSLQDALRLRPDINTSYWCNTDENKLQFLSEIIEWQEDELFLAN